MFYEWKPYVPVAKRRAHAAKRLAKLQKKSGQVATPVVIEGKTIARTFWGKSWCDNLERYSDYANRLPRGRTYARNSSVVDLKIGKGQVDAMVSGSDLYNITVAVETLADTRFRLRAVDESELVAEAAEGAALAQPSQSSDRLLDDSGLSELFGLNLHGQDAEPPEPTVKRKAKAKPKSRAKKAVKKRPAKAL